MINKFTSPVKPLPQSPHLKNQLPTRYLHLDCLIGTSNLTYQSQTIIDFHKLPNPTHPLVFSTSATINPSFQSPRSKTLESFFTPHHLSLPNHSMTISSNSFDSIQFPSPETDLIILVWSFYLKVIFCPKMGFRKLKMQLFSHWMVQFLFFIIRFCLVFLFVFPRLFS